MTKAYRFTRKKLIEEKGDEIHIPALKLLKQKAAGTIIFELVKEYGFSVKQVPEIIKLAESETGKFIESASHRILKNRKWLVISKLADPTSELIVIDEGEKKTAFGARTLQIDKLSIDQFKISTENTIAQFDAATIEYPLLLRKWK